MPGIISDDIGSFPLPAGADRETMRKAALEIAGGTAPDAARETFERVVGDMMRMKISSGIMRPNYPQVSDMVSFYLELMEGRSEKGRPWLVRKKHAVIPELCVLGGIAKERFDQTGEPLKVRVCVTGPLELYLKRAGGIVEEDLLMNVAKSVSRFIGNSIIETRYMKTSLVSIDEPSLGLNPNLAIDPDVLAGAWEKAAKKAGRRDVAMHLHSANSVDLLYCVAKVNVIGVEYAANPKALDLLDRCEIESYDKFLRVGVARTDINRLASEYAEKYGVDLWKSRGFSGLAEKMETVENIAKRLHSACAVFGERIKYAGPDCGLGGWPDQAAAYSILRNAAQAIAGYNRRGRKVF